MGKQHALDELKSRNGDRRRGGDDLRNEHRREKDDLRKNSSKEDEDHHHRNRDKCLTKRSSSHRRDDGSRRNDRRKDEDYKNRDDRHRSRLDDGTDDGRNSKDAQSSRSKSKSNDEKLDHRIEQRQDKDKLDKQRSRNKSRDDERRSRNDERRSRNDERRSRDERSRDGERRSRDGERRSRDDERSSRDDKYKLITASSSATKVKNFRNDQLDLSRSNDRCKSKEGDVKHRSGERRERNSKAKNPMNLNDEHSQANRDDNSPNRRLTNDEKTKFGDQIDFLSEGFNAELVLRLENSELCLPVPNAKIYNNLDEYAIKSFPSSKKSTVEQSELDLLRRQHEIKERMKGEIALLDLKRPRKDPNKSIPKTVLMLMEENESGLVNFLNKRLRIFIRRRRKSKHACEQYACLFGQLMFYDRHWNLILSDVSETVQFVNQADEKDAMMKETREDAPKSELNNDELSLSASLISSIDNRRLLIGKNLELKNAIRISIRERHFTKLFIRGDSIIYISKV